MSKKSKLLIVATAMRLRYSVQSLKHQQKAALFTFIPMNRQRISNDLLV